MISWQVSHYLANSFKFYTQLNKLDGVALFVTGPPTTIFTSLSEDKIK